MVSIIDLFINWKDGSFYFSILDFSTKVGAFLNIGYCEGKFYGDFLFLKRPVLWLIDKVKEFFSK
jgi:hypothetical protein